MDLEMEIDCPIIFDGPRLLIREIKTFKAAEHFGKKRGWCTMYPNTYSRTYGSEKGKLYNFFIKPKERAEAQLFVSHKGYTEFKLKFNRNEQLDIFLKQDMETYNWVDGNLGVNIGSMHKIREPIRRYMNREPFIDYERRYHEPSRFVDVDSFIGRNDPLTYHSMRIGCNWPVDIIADHIIHVHDRNNEPEMVYHLRQMNITRGKTVFITEEENFIGLLDRVRGISWFELLDFRMVDNTVYLQFFLEDGEISADDQLKRAYESASLYEIVGGNVREKRSFEYQYMHQRNRPWRDQM